MTPEALKSCTFYEALIRRGGQAYLVGGCVRDELLGKTLKDLDIIVRHVPMEELIRLLKGHGRTNLVGKSFGVIKFNPRENPEIQFDIALPRTEISVGDHHRDFQVEYDPELPLEQDLQRRDFTINAIAQDLNTGELIDPFGGERDIRDGVLRTVFKNSFLEDPLRLLRAVQFAARLKFRIEDETFEDMKRHAGLIRTVAKERVVEEIRKLFLAEKPSVGFDLMRDTGLLQILFPDVFKMIGVTQPNKKNEDVYTHTMKVLDAARSADELERPGNVEIMFAALFHDAGKPRTRKESGEEIQRVTFHNHQLVSTGIAWHWLKNYRATTIGIDPSHVCHLVKHHMFETKEFHNERALRRFINKVGKDNVFDLLDLRLADKKGGRFPKKVFGILQLRDRIRDEINKKPPFSPKDLALTGHDIIELGFKPGPVIGTIQKYLMEKVLDEPELNTKEELSRLVEENRAEFETVAVGRPR